MDDRWQYLDFGKYFANDIASEFAELLVTPKLRGKGRDLSRKLAFSNDTRFADTQGAVTAAFFAIAHDQYILAHIQRRRENEFNPESSKRRAFNQVRFTLLTSDELWTHYISGHSPLTAALYHPDFTSRGEALPKLLDYTTRTGEDQAPLIDADKMYASWEAELFERWHSWIDVIVERVIAVVEDDEKRQVQIVYDDAVSQWEQLYIAQMVQRITLPILGKPISFALDVLTGRTSRPYQLQFIHVGESQGELPVPPEDAMRLDSLRSSPPASQQRLTDWFGQMRGVSWREANTRYYSVESLLQKESRNYDLAHKFAVEEYEANSVYKIKVACAADNGDVVRREVGSLAPEQRKSLLNTSYGETILRYLLADLSNKEQFEKWLHDWLAVENYYSSHLVLLKEAIGTAPTAIVTESMGDDAARDVWLAVGSAVADLLRQGNTLFDKKTLTNVSTTSHLTELLFIVLDVPDNTFPIVWRELPKAPITNERGQIDLKRGERYLGQLSAEVTIHPPASTLEFDDSFLEEAAFSLNGIIRFLTYIQHQIQHSTSALSPKHFFLLYSLASSTGNTKFVGERSSQLLNQADQQSLVSTKLVAWTLNYLNTPNETWFQGNHQRPNGYNLLAEINGSKSKQKKNNTDWTGYRRMLQAEKPLAPSAEQAQSWLERGRQDKKLQIVYGCLQQFARNQQFLIKPLLRYLPATFPTDIVLASDAYSRLFEEQVPASSSLLHDARNRYYRESVNAPLFYLAMWHTLQRNNLQAIGTNDFQTLFEDYWRKDSAKLSSVPYLEKAVSEMIQGRGLDQIEDQYWAKLFRQEGFSERFAEMESTTKRQMLYAFVRPTVMQRLFQGVDDHQIEQRTELLRLMGDVNLFPRMPKDDVAELSRKVLRGFFDNAPTQLSKVRDRTLLKRLREAEEVWDRYLEQPIQVVDSSTATGEAGPTSLFARILTSNRWKLYAGMGLIIAVLVSGAIFYAMRNIGAAQPPTDLPPTLSAGDIELTQAVEVAALTRVAPPTETPEPTPTSTETPTPTPTATPTPTILPTEEPTANFALASWDRIVGNVHYTTINADNNLARVYRLDSAESSQQLITESAPLTSINSYTTGYLYTLAALDTVKHIDGNNDIQTAPSVAAEHEGVIYANGRIVSTCSGLLCVFLNTFPTDENTTGRFLFNSDSDPFLEQTASRQDPNRTITALTEEERARDVVFAANDDIYRGVLVDSDQVPAFVTVEKLAEMETNAEITDLSIIDDVPDDAKMRLAVLQSAGEAWQLTLLEFSEDAEQRLIQAMLP